MRILKNYFWIFSQLNWTKSNYLYLFDQFLQQIKVLSAEVLHVGEIDRRISLTVRTDIFVNIVSFRLQNANTPAVKPVLTFIAANIKSVNKHSTHYYPTFKGPFFFFNQTRKIVPNYLSNSDLLRFIIRLFTKTIKFLGITCVAAFRANELW